MASRPTIFRRCREPQVAPRTSPTNIGLALLSTVAANDFGWIGTGEMVERMEATFATMAKLERYRGHFFNWYDTESLLPLEPRYVSTVDSGNLAGHLIAFRNACLDRLEEPASIERALAGRRGSARSSCARPRRRYPSGIGSRVVTYRQLEEAVRETAALLSPAPASPDEWAERLRALSCRAEILVDIGLALVQEGGRSEAERRARVGEGGSRLRRRAMRATPGAKQGAEGEEAFARRSSPPSPPPRRRMAQEMDFAFLYDSGLASSSRSAIACPTAHWTPGHYDLLASEARLASFVAIALGDVPVEHWFHLGRPLTPVGRGSALMSWSGSMFEYLMPDLVLEAPPASLLEQTNRLAVRRQIRYGEERGVPWGTSEAAYNARDVQFTYQYSNFGVSGLGLKRGLSEDLVVAPYATALAAMVEPVEALENFERLASIGALGRYGYYESIDYTPTRVPEGAAFAIVRAFMAHHQGMTIVALANVLLGSVMRGRFRDEPAVQATELLLQERTPRTVAVARPDRRRGAAAPRAR